jgi:hypothetical protein
MCDGNKLPPIEEYSFEGIMGAISPDISEDIDAIAQILGRSRLVLADQHDSHLPPTGEIRATQLQAVAEASASNERLAADNVMILNDEASLVEGSHSGSAAYGLLERLQALPRTRRLHSDLPAPLNRPRTASTGRTNSSPAVLADPVAATDPAPVSAAPRSSRDLLVTNTDEDNGATASRMTAAVVSEVYLSAGAGGAVLSDPPIVSESGRHYPLYSYDESNLFEGSASNRATNLSFRDRMRRLLLLQDFGDWATGHPAGGSGGIVSAESRLRGLLGRRDATQAGLAVRNTGFQQEAGMYD